MVIQQNSHKLLLMDILMSETCWAHKKWKKIASDIKLVFYSSSITYSECVSVDLITQHAKHMRHFVICGLSNFTIFSHIIS